MYVEIDDTVNYGTNLWFAFTASTGISKLFTYTPNFSEQPQQAAISEGTEDTPDTKSH
jgi:hypothetical protein